MGRLAVEAGFPPGVLQFVNGDGKIGASLVSNMNIASISFTGSTGVGRIVQDLANKSNMKKVTLELGGKSAAIVFDDADLENALLAYVLKQRPERSGKIMLTEPQGNGRVPAQLRTNLHRCVPHDPLWSVHTHRS